VDVAMGQIPRSTERISSFENVLQNNFWCALYADTDITPH